MRELSKRRMATSLPGGRAVAVVANYVVEQE